MCESYFIFLLEGSVEYTASSCRDHATEVPISDSSECCDIVLNVAPAKNKTRDDVELISS